MDPIEQVLVELSEKCMQAWHGKGTECSACPIGEMAALAAAALEFYRIRTHPRHEVVDTHWSTEWRKPE